MSAHHQTPKLYRYEPISNGENEFDDEEYIHQNRSSASSISIDRLVPRTWMMPNFRQLLSFRLPLLLFVAMLLFVIQFRPVSHHPNSILPSASDHHNNRTSIESLLNLAAINDSSHGEILRTLSASVSDKEQKAVDGRSESSITISNLVTNDTCPLVPPKLVGRLKVLNDPINSTWERLEELLSDVEIGGRYRPKTCRSRNRVAIIIPYRDREHHLRTLLLNLHPMLMRQNIDYGIYVVEQYGNGLFNRAKLFNVGFLEASKQYPYDCFIFHDVDLVPEDDRNLYTCPEQPRHMSVAVDKFNYRLPYRSIFGGVSALTKEQFLTVNGFSNEFWGWGGEDDDMSNRVRHYNYKISRYSADIARYKMLKHKGTAPDVDRFKKLSNGWRRYKTDGINNTKYRVVDLVFRKLYTWVLADIFPPTKRRGRSWR